MSLVITILNLVDAIFLYTKPPAKLYFVLSESSTAFDYSIDKKVSTDDGYIADGILLCKHLNESNLWLDSNDILYEKLINYTDIGSPFIQLNYVLLYFIIRYLTMYLRVKSTHTSSTVGMGQISQGIVRWQYCKEKSHS